MLVDLRNHIVTKAGTWTDATLLASEQPRFSLADTFTASKLMLRWPNDAVTLAGPLRVRVSFQSENVTYPVSFNATDTKWATDAPALAAGGGGGHELHELTYKPPGVYSEEVEHKTHLVPGAVGVHASTVYSYVLDIPAAQAWPFRFREDAMMRKLGTNFGYRVIVEPAFETPVSVGVTNELPCDFASVVEPDVGRFFPAACEPCPPGSSIGLPPLGPALGIPAADGGCIRPRWFNGQFITREDLETEQRYFRLKQRLQNRAMGEGVVWGFAVGKAGNHICVMPGYGVDCCGNDLTLSTIYKVDIATLLRDPAAYAHDRAPQRAVLRAPRVDEANVARDAPGRVANVDREAVDLQRRPARGAVLDRGCFEPARFDPRRGARMHLLLEYIECPSDPRPVHSDPCAGTANRCEMSRIRETVRLRLVPPRDYTVEGPIKSFLDRVAALRTARPLTETVVPLETEVDAPFSIKLTMITPQGGSDTTISLDEASRTVSAPGPIQSLRVTVRVNPVYVFTEGTLRARNGQNQPVPPTPMPLASDGFSQELVVEMPVSTTSAQLDIELDGWVAQSYLSRDGAVLAGTARLGITQVASNQLRVTVDPASNDIQRGTLDIAEVCAGESCLPRGQEPVLPHLPWLHADPVHPSVAGDPKVLVLAALGGWLTKLLAAHRNGVDDEFSAKRTLATALYEATWLLFYGQAHGTTATQTSNALCNLFRDWCEAFLYKGPTCKGEPHGVVIGCAVVTGGTISEIDMYGGRRWVMHGPLIGHWMGQLGIAPIDVTASRFLSQLCCVASLPSIGSLEALPTLVMRVGSGYVTFGTPDEVKAELQSRYDVTITHHEVVGFVELVARFLDVQGEDSRAGAATRYSLGSPMQDRVLSVVVVTR